jgi:hypothetical protein
MKLDTEYIKNFFKPEKSEIISGSISIVVLGIIFIFYFSAHNLLKSQGLLFNNNNIVNFILPFLFLGGLVFTISSMIIILGKATQYIGKKFVNE